MLSIGIVGLPNVGKSSLFNGLTKNDILVANYPFATIEPNTGIVNVIDKRLIKLQELYNAKKITPATIRFVDIAGLVKGANKGEGLGNLFLSHIRQTDLIAHVVRVFNDKDITHVNNRLNPKDDIDIINTELVLADLQSIEKQIPKIEKEAKTNPKLRTKLELAKDIKETLDNNIPLWNKTGYDPLILKSFGLITSKPIIYIFNIDETDLNNQSLQKELSDLIYPYKSLFISAKLENELKTLNEAEAEELLSIYQQSTNGLSQLTALAYDQLGLQSFLTAGEKEVRAWTIKKESTAPQAAGEIHTDFEKGFIAAEIMDYNDLLKYGSYQAVKQSGKLRTEGKTYIMQENDIVDFKFNL